MKTNTRFALVAYLFFFPGFLALGQDRGVQPILNQPNGKGIVRALVIGISDYQDPDIPDLQYAHRDAEALVGFLRSGAGGSLPDSQIVFLTNEQATGGRIISGIYWLLENSKKDDVAIIYLAGHGDVETKIMDQWGYFLPWDAPAKLYMAGALSMKLIQEGIIPTLSLQKGVQVILISDACRAGKLAGSSIGGPQITAQKMLQQYANEIKILSCQPNEFAHEGSQWGGGRGVFSYHLLEGLYGLADQNHDSIISLLEIQRYLEDQVPKEVAPLSQVPLAVGNRNSEIVRVNAAELLKVYQRKNITAPGFSGARDRAEFAGWFGQTDSSLAKIYLKFLRAIDAKNFFEPAEDNADIWYSQLIQAPEFAQHKPALTRQYAAALQDNAQQALNRLLKIDASEFASSNFERFEKYREYPRQLQRAASLLGPEHYFFKELKSREHLFEAILLYLGNPQSSAPSFWEPVMIELNKALEFQYTSAPTHFYKAVTYARWVANPDSAIFYTNEAVKYAQTWVLPYVFLGYDLSRKYQRFDEAKIWIDKALEIDSNEVYSWKALASWHFYQQQIPEALQAFRKIVDLDPSNPLSWLNLGQVLRVAGDLKEAERAMLHSLSLDSVQYTGYYGLATLYVSQQRNAEAERMFLKAIENAPKATFARQGLALLYSGQQRYDEAAFWMEKVLELTPEDSEAWYNLACIQALSGKKEAALNSFEKALNLGFDDLENILQDTELENIKNTPKFNQLLKEYFPSEKQD